jgi:hypothetical protein
MNQSGDKRHGKMQEHKPHGKYEMWDAELSSTKLKNYQVRPRLWRRIRWGGWSRMVMSHDNVGTIYQILSMPFFMKKEKSAIQHMDAPRKWQAQLVRRSPPLYASEQTL